MPLCHSRPRLLHSLTHCCAWPAEGRSVLHIEWSWPAIQAAPTYRPMSSSTCCSQFLRGRPGGRFQSAVTSKFRPHPYTVVGKRRKTGASSSYSFEFNPLDSKGNYSATSKLVHWPLMGGLLHLVQRGGAPPSPLLAVPNVRAHPSTSSVPITILLYDGPLLWGFNVAFKGLRWRWWSQVCTGWRHGCGCWRWD